MSKRPVIQAVDQSIEDAEMEIEQSETVEDGFADHIEHDYHEEWAEEEHPRHRFAWVLPTLAIGIILGWTGFFGWARSSELLAYPSPATWTGIIAQWAVPVLLVVALWLLAMRNSTREAARFSQVANSLSSQSAELEERLAVINRELSLAREFLTSQTRELDSIGRIATTRISEHADNLQSLISDNAEQVDSIAKVSVTARENMERLRGDLPVIANSARDVSNQIGGAGREARGQLDDLIHGFERLNEFGSASERQVGSLQTRIDDALAAFKRQADQMGEIAEQRFIALRENSEEFCGELDSREVDALASIRARCDALRNELADIDDASAREYEAATGNLRDRLALVRRESAEVANQIRDGEAHAITAWKSQVDAMKDRLSEAIVEINQIDEAALASAREKLQSLQTEAASVDERIAERNRVFGEDMARRSADFDEAEQAARASLTERLDALDAVISERREAQARQLETMAAEGDALAQKIASLGATFETVSSQGREASEVLTTGIDTLTASLTESREALDGTDMAVAALTDSSVRLLELIQASAKHSRDDLPAAMEASETRLAAIERRADEIKSLLDEAGAIGETLTLNIDAAEARSREAIAGADEFQSRFGDVAQTQLDGIERLRASLEALDADSSAIAERAQGELRNAIIALEESARAALAGIETDQAERIAKIAQKVGEQSADAIDRALREHTHESVTLLDQATERSAEAGRDVTRQLRDQLAKVNELTANLESRIAHARERATEDVGNDFSRRVALISESLNSNAIDIAKALSTEVTDTAWASYLRGDRGIFTRRAVRLLDNTEAREIAELYDADHDFREHVSRYIHDFEAMLRTMLSTRDGNAVSVTLLSSDMGKLYVVLAQALERLRQ